MVRRGVFIKKNHNNGTIFLWNVFMWRRHGSGTTSHSIDLKDESSTLIYHFNRMVFVENKKEPVRVLIPLLLRIWDGSTTTILNLSFYFLCVQQDCFSIPLKSMASWKKYKSPLLFAVLCNTWICCLIWRVSGD